MSLIKQKGVAVIEFAIVLPVLLLLMLGVAEFGRALFQYNTLTKAVRDAARYYASNLYSGSGGNTNTAAVPNATNLVTYGNTAGTGTPLLPPGTAPTVTTSTSSDATGTYVTVSATYTFQWIPGNPLPGIVGLFGGSLANSLNLSASSTMRVL